MVDLPETFVDGMRTTTSTVCDGLAKDRRDLVS